MREVVIFRHVRSEGPGYLAEFLAARGLPFRLVRVDVNEALPDSIDECAGLVFMGGPMSANDRLPWIPRSLNLIRQAVAADIPVLGHCLGAQLMCKALGGRVRRNRRREIGWLPVTRVANPQADRWLEGVPERFEAFHWHGETFSIPAGATHLLRSRHCRNQAFALGKNLALQCHVEMTPELVHHWARVNRAEIASPEPTVHSRRRMAILLERKVAALHDIADRLYERWIRGLRR